MITAAKKQYIEACLRQSMKQSKITYEVVEEADCVLVEFEYKEIILMLTDCDD